MTVRSSVFEGQLETLKREGYTVIPLRALVAHVRGTGPPPPHRAVVLTVDDAHRSVYSDMLPILRRHRVPVTLFVYPSAVSNAAYALTWEQLRELRATGLVDVQSHTYWHPNFLEEKRRLSAQAYEQLLLRMRGHSLAEVRACADAMLRELRKVIPAFLKRVDAPERGVVWSSYLAETRTAVTEAAQGVLGSTPPEPRDEVTLTEFEPEGEVKVVAAALYAASALPDDQLLAIARRLTGAERAAVLDAYVGKRQNRRHRPGRALERTAYRFDVLADYGAFRDLQRHRLLTLEWQRLTPSHGYVMPEAVEEAGAADDFRRVMGEAAALHDAIAGAGLPEVASYAVSMAYRVRFYMAMNAREAMHVIELRSAPQGHPSYRRIAQAMHRLIAERAGHRALAAAMTFADHSAVDLERLEAERAAERRRLQR
jgi:thymidylate synthase ThyX